MLTKLWGVEELFCLHLAGPCKSPDYDPHLRLPRSITGPLKLPKDLLDLPPPMLREFRCNSFYRNFSAKRALACIVQSAKVQHALKRLEMFGQIEVKYETKGGRTRKLVFPREGEWWKLFD